MLQNHTEIMQNPGPQLLFKTINQSGADLQILFWAFDINKWTQLKSDVLYEVYDACRIAQINII